MRFADDVQGRGLIQFPLQIISLTEYVLLSSYSESGIRVQDQQNICINVTSTAPCIVNFQFTV